MRRWSAMLRPAFVVVLIAACLVIPRASRAQGPAAAFIEQRITQAGQVPRLPQGQSDLPGRKAAALGSQRWKIETVDTGLGLYDGRVCLRLDAEGRPHIVYGQGYTGLRYARWDGYAWQTETLVAGQDVAQSTSLALDSLGSPHIVYGARQGLFYLRRSGGAWVSECIDPHAVNTMTFLASLALDRSGRPHVAYADQSRACVYYATASGGAWSIATVACGLGEWSGCPSLALDSRDRPAIGYSNGPHVFLARPSGAAWQSELVANDMVGDVSLRFDAQDRPHLAYCHQEDSGLHYALRSDGAWHDVEVCRDAGTYHELAIDRLGRPNIACLRRYVGDVAYAHSNGSVWQTETIQPASHSSEPSIFRIISLALDAGGLAHVAYVASSELRYACSISNLGQWSKLAFASARGPSWDVYTAEGDGSFPWQRTADAATDTTPAWNRGASRLAFVSDRSGSPQIYTLSADGSSLGRVTRTGASELLPKWSPDGRQLAFYSSRHDSADPASNYEVYRQDWSSSTDQRLTTWPGFDGHPAWSPDGAQVVFVSDRSGSYELWRMNADGSQQRQVSSGLRWAAYPAWSPDGQWIACNDDVNADGWFDLAVMRADGSDVRHPLGASPTAYDYQGPSWSPDGRNLAFTRMRYLQYQGRWYWVEARILGLDLESSSTCELGSSDGDAFPSWETTDTAPPLARVLPLPTVTNALTFPVAWVGKEVGPAGLRNYDVQFRDDAAGVWTDWQPGTAATCAEFGGEYGHTYAFRCRARDWAGNAGAYRETADTSVSIYRYALSGQVRNMHDLPVAGADLSAEPQALRPAQSDWRGSFTLYFGDAVTCALRATCRGYYLPDDMCGVAVPGEAPGPILYLHPEDEWAPGGGGFEDPALSPWQVTGAVTLTHEAHSGLQAAALGPGASSLVYTCTFTPCLGYPATLSVLYRATAADPGRDALRVSLIGPGETYSTTVPLDVGGWRRGWCDMPACPSPQFSLRIELVQGDPRQPARVLIDEVSLGEAPAGAPVPVFLPVVRKAIL